MAAETRHLIEISMRSKMMVLYYGKFKMPPMVGMNVAETICIFKDRW